MKRKEYIKPEMQVILLKSNTSLLTVSMGLDSSDENQVNNEWEVL